ncbi:MAG: KUP/HAK/KT family potassium transporter [Candidatus Eremiobacteraeota bacterium]|nr:KUP/HAK/KT family potassium transporter [Candidatus Eremiobacteraeota bacterium]MBV8223271.1 KUP/HAK/KT family potassium transporter [Candidatus Eremiobacteraeota bacterium]
MSKLRDRNLPLVIAALGVVFGDIGTSPLYTLPSCFTFSGAHPVREDILGICSLIVWALIIVVCIKYIGFIMKVDHDGEGGILALLALAGKPSGRGGLVATGLLTTIVVVGAAMLFGDGIITPAISVISAVEGLGVASSAFNAWIVPISVVILIILFAIQVRGTERVGRLFGPAMIVWFLSIGIAGAIAIARNPSVLWAIDPRHALTFAQHHGPGGFLVLGGVVLAVTGVEALYADLSHFGRAPIVRAWYLFVFPPCVLSYLGQGANLEMHPDALNNSFYALTPGWTLMPMVVVATIATVIASQALISGAFTLVEQAIHLGLSPRIEVRHTSRRIIGQVYLPGVAWALAVGCILLTVTFRTSAHLAAAFGLAVSMTMLATDVAFYAVITRVLHWKRYVAIPLVLFFVIVDGSFVLAGLPKFAEGAWLPLAIAAVLSTVSLTWLEGRKRLHAALAAQQTPVEEVIKTIHRESGLPVETMVFLTPDPNGVPFVASHRWIRERARNERIILLHLAPVRQPYITDDNRVTVETLSPQLVRVRGRFGFMEPPRIEPVLRACETQGLGIDNPETSFFYADPKIVAGGDRGFPGWRRWLFAVLSRNSRPLPDDLQIPPERRVELGVTVAL